MSARDLIQDALAVALAIVLVGGSALLAAHFEPAYDCNLVGTCHDWTNEEGL